MTDTIELQVAIKRAGLTSRDMARRIGVSDTSFYQKCHNKTEFKVSEIRTIADTLKLTIEDVQRIFFA